MCIHNTKLLQMVNQIVDCQLLFRLPLYVFGEMHKNKLLNTV